MKTGEPCSSQNITRINYNRKLKERWRTDNLERRLIYEAKWRKKRVTCPYCNDIVGIAKIAAHLRTHKGFIQYPTAGQLIWN